jgi:hypothetical protein
LKFGYSAGEMEREEQQPHVSVMHIYPYHKSYFEHGTWLSYRRIPIHFPRSYLRNCLHLLTSEAELDLIPKHRRRMLALCGSLYTEPFLSGPEVEPSWLE